MVWVKRILFRWLPRERWKKKKQNGEIVDSTVAYLMLGCCVGFSENAENYGSLIDCIQFCGLNLNRVSLLCMMSDRSKACDSVYFQKLKRAS